MGIEKPFVFKDIDKWLNNIINLNNNRSSYSLSITGPSLFISIAIKTRTGNIFKGYKYPSH